MTIAIALATRNRPALLLDTIARTLPNIELPSTVLHLMLDEDDEATRSAVEAAKLAWGDRVFVNVKPREDTVAEKFNRVMENDADVYLAMVDHTPILTRGFDRKIVETAALFPDGIGVVVNHLANASFTGMYAPTKCLVQKMGYVFPPYFPYWFIDHWLDDLARLIGRMAYVDVVSDSSRKQNTQELREPAWWATWFDAAYLMRRKQARDIIDGEDFLEPEWRKQVLRNHYPLIEYRSKWVNESVRQMGQQLSRASNLNLSDERYQRIRCKAVAMLPHLLEDFGMEKAEAAAYRDYLTPPTQVLSLARA